MRIIFALIISSSILFAQNINEKILFASARGEIDSLNKYLLADTINLNYRYKNGYSALDYAIERNHKSVFKRLIEYYSSVYKTPNPTDIKTSKLLLAILESNIKEASKLLEEGADPNNQHISGYYPISIASRWEEYEIIKLLLYHGADVNTVNKNKYDTTPLIELSRNGNTVIGKLLLSKGAEIDFVDVNNDSAINWATYFGQIEFVKLLLNNGARTDIIGENSGDNALAIAKRMKHEEIVKILENKNSLK